MNYINKSISINTLLGMNANMIRLKYRKLDRHIHVNIFFSLLELICNSKIVWDLRNTFFSGMSGIIFFYFIMNLRLFHFVFTFNLFHSCFFFINLSSISVFFSELFSLKKLSYSLGILIHLHLLFLSNFPLYNLNIFSSFPCLPHPLFISHSLETKRRTIIPSQHQIGLNSVESCQRLRSTWFTVLGRVNEACKEGH